MTWWGFMRTCLRDAFSHAHVKYTLLFRLGGIALHSLFPRKTWHCCWTARRRWPVHYLVETTQKSTPTASQCLERVCSMRRFSRWGSNCAVIISYYTVCAWLLDVFHLHSLKRYISFTCGWHVTFFPSFTSLVRGPFKNNWRCLFDLVHFNNRSNIHM